MHALSAQKILSIWEVGLKQHPIDRYLLILAMAFPEISQEELPVLSIGQRDRYLLAIREATFGTELASFTRCPACQEPLEFTCTTTDITVLPDVEASSQMYQVSIDGYELAFRVPNSLDLAAIVHCSNLIVAQQLLIDRCVLRASRYAVDMTPADLPEAVTRALVEQMAEHDPQAEIQIALTCPACEHCWSQLFDISAFIWVEIAAYAKRLLRETHTLARAYGWREADILALSATRRAFYLEMVT